MILSDKDKEFIEFAWGCINRARYCDAKQLTDVYNRCFADRVNFTPLAPTSCGSCLRQRVAELKRELDKVMAKIENEKVVTEEPVQEDVIDTIENETMQEKEESTAKPRKKRKAEKD